MTCNYVAPNKRGDGHGKGVGRTPVVRQQHRNQLQLANTRLGSGVLFLSPVTPSVLGTSHLIVP